MTENLQQPEIQELSTEKLPELSLGERRVRTQFNVNRDELVDHIKMESAALINRLQQVKSPATEDSYEYKEKSIVEKLAVIEKNELVEIAQRKVEEAAMWAVKAVTA